MDAKMMLNQILNYYGLNINQLSSEVGQGKQTFYDINKGKIKSFSPDVAEKIVKRYSDIDFIWLTTGKGSMINKSISATIKGSDNTTTNISGDNNVNITNNGIDYKDDLIASQQKEIESLMTIPQGELVPKEYSNTLQVRIVTNKAKAGWSDGYYNDEYLEDMPLITIDADASYKGNYLAFEVAGDSMEPDYLEGDIVICREVQRHLWKSKLHFKDWDFVIAHNTQGIMLKEIIDHNVENGDIVCRSINPTHKDFTLNLREIAHLYNVVEVRQKGKRKRWNRAKDFFE